MQAQGSGSIVNISSTMGERGAANVSFYTGSKDAVEGITKSAALEGAAYALTSLPLRRGRPKRQCSIV
jgi:NAD(P)-dependent dehydrogenase (short-subunit alcohol dehydrogenase family)